MLKNFKVETKEKWEYDRKIVIEQFGKDVPSEPPKKHLSPRLDYLNQNHIKQVQRKVWESWPKLDWEEAQTIASQVNVEKLKTLALQTGFPFSDVLEEILNDVKNGASIGVKKEFEVASESTNAPTTYQFGGEVSDALFKMLTKKNLMVPFEENEIPWGKLRCLG